MIFDLFCHSPGPQGLEPKKCAVARPVHMRNSHTELGWISSTGLGGDSALDGRTDGRTDKPFGPSLGSKVTGQILFCCCTSDPCQPLTTKFGWISSNGLGGESVTDGGDCNTPIAIFKKRGDKNLTSPLLYHHKTSLSLFDVQKCNCIVFMHKWLSILLNAFGGVLLYHTTSKRLLIPCLQIRVIKVFFVISLPKHMLWVLKWTF